MPKRTEIALLVQTKAFLELSPDTAMLFAPFGCTHHLPPVSPFLLMQNLVPISKGYVSWCIYTLWATGLGEYLIELRLLTIFFYISTSWEGQPYSIVDRNAKQKYFLMSVMSFVCHASQISYTWKTQVYSICGTASDDTLSFFWSSWRVIQTTSQSVD